MTHGAAVFAERASGAEMNTDLPVVFFLGSLLLILS